ncbi:MAG TPA: universal stress protein [bacterium]|nr:universal stress protein [bacterium]
MDISKLKEGLFDKILFCTDFSKNADLAFDYAIYAARRHPGSTLYLLHVIPEPEAQFWKTYLYEVDGIDEKARQDIDARIAEVYRPRVPEEVHLEVVIRIGRDYVKILEFAEEANVDLIVIGRQGRSSWGRVLFGSVMEKVTRKAQCAVMLIPLSAASEHADSSPDSV